MTVPYFATTFPASHRRVKVWLVALCAGMAMSSVGCGRWSLVADRVPAETQSDDPSPFLLSDQPGAPEGDRIVVVRMQFDVLRVELPVDPVHHSQKTWNYVDELGGDPSRTALLRRNGLRMGTASTDSWAALRAMFDACQARVLRATHVVQRGLPLTLELDTIEEDEPLFLLTADNRMVGRTLRTGHKYLHLDYAINTDDAGTVTIQVTPEVHLLGALRFESDQRGSVGRARPYQGMVFHELSNTLEVAAGEFLVIGPDAESSTPLAVGRRFLTRKHDGRAYETVLCITPQLFRAKPSRRR